MVRKDSFSSQTALRKKIVSVLFSFLAIIFFFFKKRPVSVLNGKLQAKNV